METGTLDVVTTPEPIAELDRLGTGRLRSRAKLAPST